MTQCRGCGGIVGLDCFNPQECEYITQQMQIADAVDRALLKAAENQQKEEYERHQREQYEQDMRDQVEDPYIPMTDTLVSLQAFDAKYKTGLTTRQAWLIAQWHETFENGSET